MVPTINLKDYISLSVYKSTSKIAVHDTFKSLVYFIIFNSFVSIQIKKQHPSAKIIPKDPCLFNIKFCKEKHLVKFLVLSWNFVTMSNGFLNLDYNLFYEIYHSNFVKLVYNGFANNS